MLEKQSDIRNMHLNFILSRYTLFGLLSFEALHGGVSLLLRFAVKSCGVSQISRSEIVILIRTVFSTLRLA